MRYLVIFLLVISATISISPCFALQGTFVDTIQFIQYLDENTALEEVKRGNLDTYYSKIPFDRIRSQENLDVYDSTGGSYSILLNPAESEKFNPFAIRDVRFALNYLVDRNLIVNELMGGFGTAMISNYGPFDADYLAIIEQLESFNFEYNLVLAQDMISSALLHANATKIDGIWHYGDIPIEISIFIRSDDSVRKSIGEILSSNLEKIGFVVKKDYGDLNKAFVIVYGSNPSDLKWNVYTEAWAGKNAFVKYDSVGLSQMYAPWFSTMPGFNDPTYWNYKNDTLDDITTKIYTGNFTTASQRDKLISEATVLGIQESVRIFLASPIDKYVVNKDVTGIVNDFGAGVPSRFTAINAQSSSDSLAIGVKQIYQGAWNPVMGFTDIHSTRIWSLLSDPGVFKHPYTGSTIPIRSSWNVTTAGPYDTLDVSDDAILWSPTLQKWIPVDPEVTATSKVRFDFEFSRWHNGIPMDINDILYLIYFTLEWGSEPQKNDKTFDTEFTPRASAVIHTLVGVDIVDEDTLDVYINYWHFDEGEIASSASMSAAMPWEIYAAMEQAVTDGKVSFSRSSATNKDHNWLSLIIPNDANLLKKYLVEFQDNGSIPAPLISLNANFDARYTATIDWIDKNNHAVIGNGPFYLDSYSPESRTITVNAFDDESYPFPAGFWSDFQDVTFSKITSVDIPTFISRDKPVQISVETIHATILYHFITSAKGDIVSFGSQDIKNNSAVISLDDTQTSLLDVGANNIKLFAVSHDVLRPDIFTSSFFATDGIIETPVPVLSQSESDITTNYDILIILIIIIISFIAYRFRKLFYSNYK